MTRASVSTDVRTFHRRVAPSHAFPEFVRSEIEQPVGRRFDAIVRVHADRMAVRMPGERWTYAKLGEAANRISRWLLREPRDRPVALWLERGPLLFAAMLGALKSGRFYVPLDPALGRSRVRAILSMANPTAIVTDRNGAADGAELAAGNVRVLLAEEIAAEGSSDDPGAAVSPDDLAYVLFTSGSTGAPKGVMQTHRNLLHNVLRLTNGLHIGPDDRLTLLSSCSFGASVSDIFGALLNGAAVCPFPLAGDGLLRLRNFIADEGITIYHSVPSVFRRLTATLEETENFSKLRLLKLGGEPVLRADFELYRRHFPRSCLFHVGLGATEMNVIRQWFADHETVCPSPLAPLGYEVDGVEIRLVNEEGSPDGTGTGEIAVVSSTLSPGYWGRPDLTAQAFAPAPGRPGERVWRTGDLGRMLPNGCLLYVGRKDSVVKVRGQRVDLLEVEAALGALPGIREGAVVAREGPGGLRLVAYVVAEPGARPGVRALHRALADRLAEPMIPGVYVFLDELPKTAAGKVDRGALPEPGSVRPDLETPFVKPADANVERVARIFGEVLRIDRVGARDDFFDLGGDSLLVVEALVCLSEAFGREISVTEFVEASTPSALAARLHAARTSPASGLVVLQKGTAPAPVFLVPGGTGDGEDLLTIARLVRFLGPAYTVFGFLAGSPPHSRLARKAAEYVRRMRSVEAHGPYVLVGECVGGILAHAMATELLAQGEAVALLALLDTPFPVDHRRLRRRRRSAREPWAPDFMRRVRYHYGALRVLDAGRLRYLLDKARAAVRTAVSRGRPPRGVHARLRVAYAGALLASAPQRFPGHMHLLLSEERRSQGTAAAWAALANSVTIAECPGDHHTYIRDYVDRVSELLRDWLEKSHPKWGRGASPGDGTTPGC